MKHPFRKYLEELNADKEILDAYRDLRLSFQKEGWSEKDLEKPPYYPKNVMVFFHKFQSLHNKLFTELKSFFPDIDHTDFNTYIGDKMKKINLEIPLENGNHKRRNNWDEDFE